MTKRFKFRAVFLAALAVSILLLATGGWADAGKSPIDPYLQSVLNSAQADDMIDAYLVLQNRLSYQDLRNQTPGMARKERRKEVVRLLKAHATNTQQSVRAYLENAQRQGTVVDIRIIWAINVIVFKATPGVINDLAQRYQEIESLHFDAKVPLEQLLDDNGITQQNMKNGLVNNPLDVPQPGLTLINAPQVWAEGDSGQGVIVANIDTGTDWTHPDLANNIWNNLGEDADGDGSTMQWTGSTWIFDPGDVNNVDDDGNGYIDDFIGWDMETNDNNPMDGQSHGTATSGIVAGDGTNGTETGVAPRAKVMILKNGGETQYWISQQYAIDNGADIVTSSLSYKWYFSPQPNYPMFRQMNDMELAAGILHTNSTSNDGNTTGIPFNISAPGNSPSAWIHPDQTLVGNFSSVIGSADVSATTGNVVSSSPWGPATWEDLQINHPSYPYPMPANYQDYPYETVPGSMGIIKPDVAAPGSGTTSTAPGGGYQSFGGTSGATPHLAGTAALMLGVNPNLEPEDVTRIMMTTATEKGDPGKDNRYGAGLVNAYAAYLQAKSELSDPGDPNPPTNADAYSDFNTPTSIDLTWNDPTTLFNGDPLSPSEFTIEIERDGANVASVNGGTGQYTDTGLTDGQLYHYVLFAKLIANDSTSLPVEVSAYAGGSPVPSAPANLAGSATTTEAQLTWNDPTTQSDGTPLDDLDHINIYRNGVVVASVAPGTETYTDTPPAGFTYDYQVTAVDNETPANESASSNAITLFVGDTPNFLVWVGPDAAAASAESGDSIFAALVANGESVLLTNNLFEFGSDLSIYEGIFVVLGIFSNNHVIGASDPEGPALDAYLAGGGKIYLEGGDCFNYDPEVGGYQIRPWFSLNDGPDGSGDLSGITGLNDLSAFSFSYSGENNWMDELQPVASTPVWQNSANSDISGIFYVGYNGGSGRALGVVPSFGGLVDNPSPLSPQQRVLAATDVARKAAAQTEKSRPVRAGEAQPFVKKAAYHPELKANRKQAGELYRITPGGGIEMLANTKDDLMAAYLEMLRTTGDPTIAVTPTALADTLLIGGSADHVVNIANVGGSLAGDLSYTISENPPVDWLSVTPASGTVTANGSDDVTVSLDAAGLSNGNYSTTLEIASNDPATPLVTVTVDLLVNDAPVMTISPGSFEVTLTPDSSTTRTLTVSNSGVGPLDFVVSIEGTAAANAKVDILANGQARTAPVIARGKEIPVAQYLKRNRHAATAQSQAAPVDESLPSVAGLQRISPFTPTSPDGEEVFGSNQNAFGPAGTRGRGNHFYCSTSTTLTEHRLYLNFATSTDMQFLVYEGDVQVGTYNLISVSEIASSGTGQGWYSSGPVSVPLQAGKYYLIYPQWTAAANYYNQQNIVPYPIPASFGELQMGWGWSVAPTYGVPAPATQNVTAAAFGAAVAYYQTIVTGAGGGGAWLTADPDTATVAPGSSVDVILTFDATGQVGGDYFADIIVSGNDPANPSDTASAHLFVEGVVSISATPDPLVFPAATFLPDTAVLTVKNSGNGLLTVSDITSSNSKFTPLQTSFDVAAFDSALVEVVFVPGAAAIETGTLSIMSNDPLTPQLDVAMEAEALDLPGIEVNPTEVNETIGALGDSTDVPMQLTNSGGAPLEWSAVAVAFKGARVVTGKNGNKGPAHSDYHVRSSERPYLALVTEDTWDLQFSANLETVTGALGNAGSEFDGTYYYSTRWGSNLLHKIDMSGNLVEEFSISGVTGLRDLAFDGTYMYGGAAGNTIYQMDFATKTLIGTISSPVAVRHIAYDAANDAFWVGNWDTNITLVSRSGATLLTITSAVHGLGGMYGSAYDGWTAGGPYLWVFDQGLGGGFPQLIHQIDLNSNTPTGVTYDVTTDFPTTAGIAGGLFTAEGIVSGTASIGGLLQGTPDNLFVYELAPAAPSFVKLVGNTSGSINPGDSDGFIVRLTAVGANPDTTFTGECVIATNIPGAEIVNIPVTMHILATGIEDGETLPTTYAVSKNYPNPFNPTTTIAYQLPEASDVRLVIYNVLGQKVRTLVSARLQPGRYQALWDARNDAGAPVGSGIYIYRFDAGEFSQVQKMILLK